MSGARKITRRAMLMLTLIASAAGAAPARRKAKGGGGDATGLDNGIGGTGVVGTIRDFGSIIINKLRITYPEDATVFIDGAPASLDDMRIGHVASVVARKRESKLSTEAIHIFSEVVGPIESMDDRTLVVLGQNAEANEGVSLDEMNVGDWVALSGLRRLDQTIDVSRIETRQPGEARVAGVPSRGDDGEYSLGDLALSGLAEADLRRRILLRGRPFGGGLQVEAVEPDPLEVPGVKAISLEAFVAQEGQSVVFADGRRLHFAPGDDGKSIEGRVVVDAVVSYGHWRLASVTRVHAPNVTQSHSPDPPTPPAPAPAPASAPAGKHHGKGGKK